MKKQQLKCYDNRRKCKYILQCEQCYRILGYFPEDRDKIMYFDPIINDDWKRNSADLEEFCIQHYRKKHFKYTNINNMSYVSVHNYINYIKCD